MERGGPVQLESRALPAFQPSPDSAYLGASSPIGELVHFHKAIKHELGRIYQEALALENGAEKDLQTLTDRYTFLHAVYKYHSSAEDEVILPALDLRVKNVAHAYSLEHKVESDLFDQMSSLLEQAASVGSNNAKRAELFRQLVCTADALQITLRNHLNKEEEQVFPLLMRHFTIEEQGALVWQFMCCIPVRLMEEVLPWMASCLSPQECQEMVGHIHDIVPREELLLQVVSTWLSKTPPAVTSEWKELVRKRGKLAEQTELFAWQSHPQGNNGEPPNKEELVDSSNQHVTKTTGTDLAGIVVVQSGSQQKEEAKIATEKFPINEIVHLHKAIHSELEGFAEEARGLQMSGKLAHATLASLMERYRFLADVCTFHSTAEDEIVFKAIDQKVKLPASYSIYHANEERQMCDVGRLLAEAHTVETGTGAATQIVAELCKKAESVALAARQHFSEEEVEVLPLLQVHFTIEEQRVLMYQSLRAMPLRLLEQMLPWLVALLSEEEASDMLQNMRLAAPEVDSALVALFSGWARKGRRSTSPGSPTAIQQAEGVEKSVILIQDCSQTAAKEGPSFSGSPWSSDSTNRHSKRRRKLEGHEVVQEVESRETDAVVGGQEPSSALRGPTLTRPLPDLASGGQVLSLGNGLAPIRSTSLSNHAMTRATSGSMSGCRNPIDNIFQFHKAIRKDLEHLDTASTRLGDCDDEYFRNFQGRFHFLWGIYRAHSNAEDEIVFPALEAKEALHNVSHSYSIDHKQEEELFEEMEGVMSELAQLRSAGLNQEGSERGEKCEQASRYQVLVARLQRMCKSVRVSLDKHVSSEELELWPLFGTHFTVQEQDSIVGCIIGRTGAEVLQAMLPWVTTALSEEEQGEMMNGWRQATRNTMFDQWLSAWWKGQSASAEPSSPPTPSSVPQAGTPESLAVVAEYLGWSSKGGLKAESSEKETPKQNLGAGRDWRSEFKPGWEDIFRMNERELEAAVRQVSRDSRLEPQRKAYLIQNLMTSRWIVAQQKNPQQGGARQGEAEGGLQGRSKSFVDEEAGVLGCEHYSRNCKLRAACCGELFTCRFCHDKVSDHSMDRHATQEMMCMECLEVQPVAQQCATPSCNGRSMAKYFCPICKFFDNDDRDIYHCPFCNLCRVGKGLGIDYFHCMTCNACMSLSLQSHTCREKGLESNCPICHDFLFTSNTPVKALPCGHFMHSACYQAYTCSHYTCPICSKSLGDMAVYFGMLDALLMAEELPEEYRSRRQDILCNDCERRSSAPFHFVYHKCSACGSYNTRTI